MDVYRELVMLHVFNYYGKWLVANYLDYDNSLWIERDYHYIKAGIFCIGLYVCRFISYILCFSHDKRVYSEIHTYSIYIAHFRLNYM